MEHFYHTLDGENWFNYETIYKKAVEICPSNSHFVEIGAWKGRSSCFMAVEIINSGKSIKFDCVDTWEHPEISLNSEEVGTDITGVYETFLKNIEPVKDTITQIKLPSWEAAELYDNESLDFIFVDGRHDYLSVRKDLQCWFPKVKVGGIIAGHDYHLDIGVFPAVHEYFQDTQNVEQHDGGCWLVIKR